VHGLLERVLDCPAGVLWRCCDFAVPRRTLRNPKMLGPANCGNCVVSQSHLRTALDSAAALISKHTCHSGQGLANVRLEPVPVTRGCDKSSAVTASPCRFGLPLAGSTDVIRQPGLAKHQAGADPTDFYQYVSMRLGMMSARDPSH